VAARAVQAVLRALFERWGRPERLRVDNGAPWGPGDDLPPPLMLWLIGLGILPIWNPPCRPTENAKVERTNGTVNRWGEPTRCGEYATWVEKLSWTARMQREVYPSVGGQSRLAAHPELLEQPRPYRRETEGEEWKLSRVTSYLAQGKWPRQVSKRGQISIYGKAYEVGRALGGQTVWVRLDAATCDWVIEGPEGDELRRHAAEQISAERICALQVSKPHASAKKRSRREQETESVTLRNAA
jgi:hypothetical protein